MLFYETLLPGEFKRVKDYAANLLAKFDAGASAAPDLLVDAKNLDHLFDALKAQLPGQVSAAGNFRRHMRYMLDHLQTGHPEYCRCDIHDICEYDLPALEEAFRKWCESPDHIDSEIAEKVYGLLAQGEYDSAIRKAFVILKERLCAAYRVPTDKDGVELVNAVFGNRAGAASALPADERQAMRNLLDGLYGVFRNKYGHNDVRPDWYEVDAVLSMINVVLRRLPRRQPLASMPAGGRSAPSVFAQMASQRR